jgi:ubiquinone/menaquinone biosynthesis C-methylase UbiE/GT2 family glycosyltransferase
MFLSVIIPSADRVSIRNCLDALFEEINLVPFEVEVIVSDDSNTSVVRKIIESEYKSVNYLVGPKRGPAANRNNGALAAKGVWLVFLDDDVVPSNSLLSSYSKIIKENKDILAFEGSVLTHDNSLLEFDLAEAPINENGGCFWSANICVKKDAFFKVGGFCEDYLIAANEDQDLFLALQKVTKVVFCRDAFVWHDVRITKLLEKISKVGRYYYSWMIFSIREGVSFWGIYFGGLKSQGSALIHSIKRRKPKAAVLALYTLFYCGLLHLIFWTRVKLMLKIKYSNRKFQWVPSVDANNLKLQVLQYRMQDFYSSLETRNDYQEMIDSNNEDLSANPVFRELINAIDMSQESKILEIGCGTGKLYYALNLSAKSNYYGVEVSKDIIESNISRFPEANWICSQVYSLPFEDAFFNNVVSFYVIEHLVFPAQGLAEMMRVVKTGGSMLLIFPDFIETKRLPSQTLGLSGYGTAKEKIKGGRIIDSLITLYDSRYRLKMALKSIKENTGNFLVNVNPKCLQSAMKTEADFDAIYIASKAELSQWAKSNNYRIEFPAGVNGIFREHAFVRIWK